jgi:glutathione S-transferase
VKTTKDHSYSLACQLSSLSRAMIGNSSRNKLIQPGRLLRQRATSVSVSARRSCVVSVKGVVAIGALAAAASATCGLAFAFSTSTSTHNSAIANKDLTGQHSNNNPRAFPISSSFSSSSTTQQLFAQSNNKYNPFGSMLGDLASALTSGGKAGVAATLSPAQEQDIASSSINQKYTWDDIRQQWDSQCSTPEEQQFRQNLAHGYGAASPLHNLRLYAPEQNIKEQDDVVRITFYRDSASWCPYCQKIWMALEQKRIPYKVERINMRCYGDKTAEFMRLQPSGQIPVCVIDGQVYGQSNDILFALDEKFPDAEGGFIAQFGNDANKSKAQELLQLERQLFGTWMQWLTGSARAKGQFVRVLDMVEQQLAKAGGPGFFMGGDTMTLVDIQFAPFLERIAASLLFYKGFQIRVVTSSDEYASTPCYPNINRWFDAMESLEAYQVTKSDYYTHCWDLPPQLGGCTFEPDGAPFEKAINGKGNADGNGHEKSTWQLPLQPHNGGVEPDWTFLNQDSNSAKREAAERLTFNHVNIAKFACRGAGSKGMPPVMAPLSDPRATSAENVQSSVDAVLKCVAMKLLLVSDGEGASNDADMVALSQAIAAVSNNEFTGDVIASIAYLRDRVGVPRDMRLPAARQFRAHLNWAIGHLQT